MRCKRMLGVLLSVITLLTMAVSFTAYAYERAQKIVRVGWYDSAFHHRDQFGRRSGYGYEYQQRIATYTGWKYEYVEGSWSTLLEKLIAGEIDILSDVSYTPKRAEKILYSAEAMGAEGYHVFITPNNNEIRPDDFSTFNGKRVGVNKNSIQEQLFKQWVEKHNVHPIIVELTAKTPKLLEMLKNGEIDMLVTLDTYGNSADVVPVVKVGFAESFFGINKNRPDLKSDLDTAMNRIFEENRDFNQQMTQKFNRSSAVNKFLTMEEREWLSQHGTIRVGYRDHFLPFCKQDENSKKLVGALADYITFAEKAEKNAKPTFEPRAYATTEAALQALAKGEIDCVFPIALSAYDGEQRGIIITDPLISTEMFAVVRTDDHRGIVVDKEMKVAVVEGNPGYDTFLKDHFPKWKAKYYKDIQSAYQAVANGEADYSLVSNYRIGLESNLFEKYKLSVLTTNKNRDLSFAVRKKDDCLYSILNKINHVVPETSLNSSLNNYAFRDTKVTLSDFVRDNLGYVVGLVASIVAIVFWMQIRNMKSEKKAEEGRQIISETEHDHLTGLYSWNFFLVYANRLCREHPEQPRDAVVMNIERFHSINALHGRDFGDKVLRELGDEISRFAEETGSIASRYEADRFDIYSPHREDWQAQLERFQARMDKLFHNANISLRMGVKPWQKDMEPVTQFDLARTACNKMRGTFKTQAAIFDAEMEKRENRDQRLLNDLNRALEKGELEVYYQPKYDIQAEHPRLSSAEALVRWRHPELGLLSPADFVPLFEQSGQITELDNYVWKEAARQIATWRSRHGVVMPVSVNLSRVDVFDPNLMEILDGIIARNELQAGDLKLEVTESAYTENAEQLIQVIEELRAKGYEIEMDDFGSGYSSLNMLSSMPIDVLKMDIAFIRNIERNEKDFRLVELIVDIARSLKVPVIAEGVETAGQLNLLRNAGCNLVQGYYFSAPLPAAEFERKILSEVEKA